MERAPHVDAVFGTHNVGRVAALLGLARSSGEPVLEVPDAPGRDEETDFPTAMAVRHDQPYAAWVTIQVGCDNSCAFCIVPAVRGPEVSRPFGELVEELGGLAARGHRRGHAARPERELLRPRPDDQVEGRSGRGGRSGLDRR